MFLDMFYLKIVLLFWAATSALGDLPPGTRRNTYLPPNEPNKGYGYDKPPGGFPSPSPQRPSPSPGFPTGPSRPPSPGFPTGPPARPPASFPSPGPRPTPSFPSPIPKPTPGGGYPAPGQRPTPEFPGYPSGSPTGIAGNPGPGEPGHVHEPGMPYDFNYAVKDDSYGTDYAHNAISDGDVVKGEYRVQLPDGRTQVVRYTADWKNGFTAQVSYEGQPRYDAPRGPPGAGGGGGNNNFQGY